MRPIFGSSLKWIISNETYLLNSFHLSLLVVYSLKRGRGTWATVVRCQMVVFVGITMSEVIDKINESAFIIHRGTSSKKWVSKYSLFACRAEMCGSMLKSWKVFRALEENPSRTTYSKQACESWVIQKVWMRMVVQIGSAGVAPEFLPKVSWLSWYSK